jgi:hypothetical protein
MATEAAMMPVPGSAVAQMVALIVVAEFIVSQLRESCREVGTYILVLLGR